MEAGVCRRGLQTAAVDTCGKIRPLFRSSRPSTAITATGVNHNFLLSTQKKGNHTQSEHTLRALSSGPT